MWLLATDTAMRVKELSGTMLQDIKGKTILIRDAKTGQNQEVGIGDRTAEVVQYYITNCRPKSGSPYLFLTGAGKQMMPHNITKRLTVCGGRLGIQHISMHMLRVSFASNIFADLRQTKFAGIMWN